MKGGIVLLNFGEPERATPEEVIPFLERIFITNAQLEGGDEAERRQRARELAERRASGLIAEYEEIGGSPLNRQAETQARMLADALRERGLAVDTFVGMQFTPPTIREALEAARRANVDLLIGLPVYPLAGPSTTVAALEEMRRERTAMEWDVRVEEVTGWHVHPGYTELRADGIRALCDDRGIPLDDPATRVVFSAHGTPLHYLREGSRYDVYVADHCRRLAAALELGDYTLGFQNHTNRPGVEWTQPDIDDAIRGVEAERVVVVPISFMHEQSETLAELDHELREEAEAFGLEFHRVPVPHDDPRFAAILADLVEPFLNGRNPGDVGYAQCRCRAVPGTLCLNHRLERDDDAAPLTISGTGPGGDD